MEDINEEAEVYLPGELLDKDQVLVPDLTTYDMLHSVSVQWPFLSIDGIKDQLGDERRNVRMSAHGLKVDIIVSTDYVFGSRDTSR
jgi:ribosome assembly protein RRB1